MSNLYGLSAYQQTSGAWNNKTTGSKSEKAASTGRTESTATKDSSVKRATWNPIDTKSSLVPTVKEGYGNVIGDVELSDKAKDYYSKLKSKFHNMDFILVSKDMKSRVQANAAAYGNASKQVVLIDEEKLERMATDESYRKKYEGIIAMSQLKLAEAKNSLASSGAGVKNFGMSVNSDGTTSFFATMEKASDAQAKLLEKKQAEKKAAKAKEKKLADKKAREERLEEKRAKKRDEENEIKDAETENIDDKEYVEIKADSMEELINKVSAYAYDSSSRQVMTEEEKQIGQRFDFRG